MEQLLLAIPRFSLVKDYFLDTKKVGIMENGATELLSQRSLDPELRKKYDIGPIPMGDIADKDFTSACNFIKLAIIVREISLSKEDEFAELINSIGNETKPMQQYLVGITDKKVRGCDPGKRARILEFIGCHPEIKQHIEEKYSVIFAPIYAPSNKMIFIKSPEKNQTALYFGIKFDSISPPFSIAELLWICGSTHDCHAKFEKKYSPANNRYIFSQSGIVYTGVPTILQLTSGAILFSIGKQ